MFEKIFEKNKKKKEEINVMVIDNYKELPDFRKVPVPDLKQHLVNGYDEIRKIREKNKELKEKLEEANNYKTLYEASLVTAEEYRKRNEEKDTEIEELERKLEQKDDEINSIREELNNQKLRNYALDERENKIIEKESNITRILTNKEQKHAAELIVSETKGKRDMQENILKAIEGIKGNISKTKLIEVISKM